jgi:hypothetical protein
MSSSLEAELAELAGRLHDVREPRPLTLAELERRLQIGEPYPVKLWGSVTAVCVPDRSLADRMAVLIVSARPIKHPPYAVPFAQGRSKEQYWYHFSIPDADIYVS